MKTTIDMPDLPPEFVHYRDEGCDLAGACLDCPFPRCVYELPGGKRRWVNKQRDRAISRLFTGEGKTVKELAAMFGVSRRTVQRVLQKQLKKGDVIENE